MPEHDTSNTENGLVLRPFGVYTDHTGHEWATPLESDDQEHVVREGGPTARTALVYHQPVIAITLEGATHDHVVGPLIGPTDEFYIVH